MKKPMLVNGTVVEKKITLRAEDIFEEIHTRTYRIINTFGDRFKPIRVLLGPNQWLILCEYCRNSPYGFGVEMERQMITFGHPDKVLGYPVGLKQSNGIEFEFRPECAFEFAQGTISERPL